MTTPVRAPNPNRVWRDKSGLWRFQCGRVKGWRNSWRNAFAAVMIHLYLKGLDASAPQ